MAKYLDIAGVSYLWSKIIALINEVEGADVTALTTAVETLIGEDTAMSARAIAAAEVAKIVGEAPAAYDTLQEIAAWISNHPDDVAAINAAITALQNKLTLGTYAETSYAPATGTYVAGDTYFTDATGETEVDTTGFEEGVTDVSSYYIEATTTPEYATVRAYVEAVVPSVVPITTEEIDTIVTPVGD